MGAGTVTESVKGTPLGHRNVDAKTEASVRKSVEEFKTWAVSKKASVTYAKLEICKDVLTIRANEIPTFICLTSVPKKEMIPKETALLEALRGGKR